MNVSAIRRDVPSRRVIASALLITMGIAKIAGNAFDLYRQFWWFDRVLHACTILAITLWLATFVFEKSLNRKRGGVLYVLLIASVGVSLGALWEVAEWCFDQVAPGDVIKGKHDTLLDIAMYTAGARLAEIISLKLAPSRSQS